MTIKRVWHFAWPWLAGILLVLVFALGWAYRHDQSAANAPMGEQIDPNEDYLTTQIIAAAIDTSVQSRAKLIASTGSPAPSSSATNPGYSPYHFTRDAHAKGHGCVMASFTVNNHVDSRYAYGVFGATKKDYNAFIRYSSGNPSIQKDHAKDVRGMAIKLYDVNGDKLMPGQGSDNSQDFILMNNPVFFIRTIEEYAQFNRMLAADFNSPFQYFHQGANILHWHVRELWLGIRAQKAPPDSLVTTRFYSGSAYMLGPRQYVKYGIIPCASNAVAPGIAKDNPDYLRLELAKQSQKGGGCFDFAVQPQVQGKNMPVEDTTVEWKESDSPFVPLARMVIQPTDNNTVAMNEQCENTAFNPWHSLEDHKPVGVMNRVRKALYMAMSRFRQTNNCGDSCDTKCDALKQVPDSACATIDPVPSK